ncbi:hypothetical protein DYBT9275_03753 [Dyadobacter sp. CECT 9275]|uniref:Uncharacterized protein n=1 Tax=Dyadobacter helix TaxID=2822344 RepID=A0A916JEL4_9BACT|nr:hypothetical protein [Dyadobacter sp. CECT 9275]CAG5006189.1 hypothetical protein DYBT9275_03753 [Dyadobacter sp. CECT 9275]
MRRFIVVLAFASFCQFSCGGSTSDNAQKTSLTELPADPKAKGGNTCLLGYANKLDQLLTLQMAADFAGLPAGSAEIKYFNSMKNTDNHDVKYSWKSDRKRNMKDVGVDMVVPVDNMVQLNGIKERSFESFKMTHRAPTDNELKQADQAMDEALDKKSGNKKVNEQVEKLDEMKVDKNTQKSVVKGMGGVFAKVARAYREVQGIGDAASWNAVERRLYVVDNGVEISVSVDLSDDDAVNEQKAVVLMKQLLAKCK